MGNTYKDMNMSDRHNHPRELHNKGNTAPKLPPAVCHSCGETQEKASLEFLPLGNVWRCLYQKQCNERTDRRGHSDYDGGFLASYLMNDE